MKIDPVEALIVWLTTALTIVEGRVAGKHRYGDDWMETQTGVSVHLDGGSPDLYAKVSEPRFELRIYSDDQAKVTQVWMDLIDLSRNNKRFTVNTRFGTALIHYFLPETILSLLFDDVLDKDMGVVFFRAMVSEEVVGEGS